MAHEQYQTIFAKVLKDSKVGNAEGIAKVLIGKMRQWDELMGDAVVLDAQPPQPSLPTQSRRFTEPENQSLDYFASNATLIGTPKAEPDVDIFQRVGPKIKQNLTDDQIESLKQRAIDNYKRNIPPVIECLPPGFTQPVKLTCQSYNAMQPSMPTFKIIYGPQGMGEAGYIDVVLNVCDDLPSPEKVIEEIQEAGKLRFFPKEVTSAPPVRTPALALGDINAMYAAANADSPQRPVENPGDGIAPDDWGRLQKSSIDGQFNQIRQRQD